MRFVMASTLSLQDDVLSFPCDGVSETKLCVSSKPSSLSSWFEPLMGFSLIISLGGLQIRSGVSVGDFKFRMASRTSSWLMELMCRPTFSSFAAVLPVVAFGSS